MAASGVAGSGVAGFGAGGVGLSATLKAGLLIGTAAASTIGMAAINLTQTGSANQLRSPTLPAAPAGTVLTEAPAGNRPVAVPEPGCLLTFALGAGGALLVRRRRR